MKRFNHFFLKLRNGAPQLYVAALAAAASALLNAKGRSCFVTLKTIYAVFTLVYCESFFLLSVVKTIPPYVSSKAKTGDSKMPAYDIFRGAAPPPSASRRNIRNSCEKCCYLASFFKSFFSCLEKGGYMKDKQFQGKIYIYCFLRIRKHFFISLRELQNLCGGAPSKKDGNVRRSRSNTFIFACFLRHNSRSHAIVEAARRRTTTHFFLLFQRMT